MMRIGRVFLAVLFVLSTITGCVARSDFEKVQSDLLASQSQLQTSQSDYTKLKSEHASLQSDFTALQSDYTALKSQRDKLQTDFDALQNEKQALADQLKASDAKLSTAELGRKSAESSLKTTRERVAKAKTEAEILNLLFSPLWSMYQSLLTHTKAGEIRDMLDKLVADTNDAQLSKKYAALSDGTNQTEATLDFIVYLVSDLADQLR